MTDKIALIELQLNTALAILMIFSGYVVAPMLFANLESQLAGDIAGQIFRVVGWSTLISSVLFFVVLKSLDRNFKNYLFIAMLMSILLLVVTPWMAEIKARNPLGITSESSDWPLFASLHGIYQVGYLIVITALIFLVWRSSKLVLTENQK